MSARPVRGQLVCAAVFLVLVGLWCAFGYYFAIRTAIAGILVRWDHLLPPIVLIGIGLVILVEGDTFGL